MKIYPWLILDNHRINPQDLTNHENNSNQRQKNSPSFSELMGIVPVSSSEVDSFVLVIESAPSANMVSSFTYNFWQVEVKVLFGKNRLHPKHIRRLSELLGFLSRMSSLSSTSKCVILYRGSIQEYKTTVYLVSGGLAQLSIICFCHTFLYNIKTVFLQFESNPDDNFIKKVSNIGFGNMSLVLLAGNFWTWLRYLLTLSAILADGQDILQLKTVISSWIQFKKGINFTTRDGCQRQNNCCGTLLQNLLLKKPRHATAVIYDNIGIEDEDEVESYQPLDVVDYEEEGDISMNSDSDEELVAAMEECLQTVNPAVETSSVNNGFQCPVCQVKIFKYRKNLKTHMKVKHDGEFDKCQKCEKKFGYTQKQCTGGEHICDECNKRCTTERGLRQHRESHEKKRKNDNPTNQPKKQLKKTHNRQSSQPPSLSAGPSNPRPPSPVAGPSNPRPPSQVAGPSNPRPPSPVAGPSNPRPPSPVAGPSNPRPPSPVAGPSNPIPPSPVAGPSNPRPPSPVAGPSNPRPPSPVAGPSNPRPPSPVAGPSNPRPPSPVAGPCNPRPPSPVEGPCNPRPPSPVAGPSNPRPPSPVEECGRLYHCRRCSYTCYSRRDLYLHRMREHYQHVPWGDNPAPWVRDDGTIDEMFREVYTANEPLILMEHETGPVQSTYNFPIANDLSVDQLVNFVDEIYEDQQHAFKLNFSFGVILQNRETGEYRYFTSYTNNVVLQSPMFISRRANLRRLYLHLRRLDILSELLATRPDTKWVPVLLTNVQFFIFSTFYPVGNGNLPQYLIEKRSMYSLAIDQQNGKKYEDSLCLFRCLAVHNGYDLLSLETPTKDYYKKWVKLTKPSKQFSGVAIEQFPDFETCYKVNLEVYSLGEDGTCQSIYKSRGRHDSTLYVNLYENHASYIKNFSCYAKKFQCKTCERHFPTSFNLHRHQANCDNKTKYVYPGGFFKSNQTVFKKLEHYDVIVPVEDRSFPWFIKVEQDQTQHLKWTQRHIPVSVSICSNVPGYNEPCCIINSDTDQLVSSMIEYMQQITNKVGDLAKEKWGWILDKLKTEECTGGSDDVSVKMQKSANQRILAEFEKYQTQVPVLGFNSANIPGVARQMIFNTAQEVGVNFAVFDKPSEDLYNTFRTGIIGGPSLVFTRHHKAGETKIRGGKYCQKIVGYDANSLYLWALDQPMPVGPYVRRQNSTGFKPDVRDKYMSAYHWMDFLNQNGAQIQHRLNCGQEKYVGKYPVDGYDVSENTIYQFQGCFFFFPWTQCMYGNSQYKKQEMVEYKRTQNTTNYLKHQGYNVVEIWECDYKELCRQNPQINDLISKSRPESYQKHKYSVTEDQILQGVMDGSFYGALEVDTEVPDQWPSYYQHPTMTPYEYFS
ncbi:hypothetical protein KUTeg_022634 [Tegillarca granosa]|uniref:C2H2-type domain-containing protein n=1 Tax=Tegillarca granosa TaxID=220873 RepID=A0ABQ9E343_TEGGR|nr:hypothetical protein KUTeg_022634 [Tegillarca granosa]